MRLEEDPAARGTSPLSELGLEPERGSDEILVESPEPNEDFAPQAQIARHHPADPVPFRRIDREGIRVGPASTTLSFLPKSQRGLPWLNHVPCNAVRFSLREGRAMCRDQPSRRDNIVIQE